MVFVIFQELYVIVMEYLTAEHFILLNTRDDISEWTMGSMKVHYNDWNFHFSWDLVQKEGKSLSGDILVDECMYVCLCRDLDDDATTKFNLPLGFQQVYTGEIG